MLRGGPKPEGTNMNGVILTQVLVQGVMLGAMYGLVSLGMTLIFVTTGLMNFAHGSFLAVAMYLALSLYTVFSLDPYVSVLITVPALFIIGWLLFRFLVRRVLDVHILMAAQITLGMLWVIESVLSTAYGNDIRSVPTHIGSSRIHLGPLVITGPYLVTFCSAVAVGILLFLLLKKTDFGRSVRALMQDRRAAQLMGIRVDIVQTAVFGLGLALLGLAGPLIVPMMPVSPFIGLQFTLFAFMIMIFGGSGNLLGSVVGGVLFGVIDSLGRFFFSGSIASLLPYSALVLVLLFRPQGLLGEK